MLFFPKYVEVVGVYILIQDKGKNVISLRGKRGTVKQWQNTRAIVDIEGIGEVSLPKKVLKRISQL